MLTITGIVDDLFVNTLLYLIVLQIAKGCSGHLEELRLNYCGNVSDRGIVFLSSSCQKLRHLMLSQCQQVLIILYLQRPLNGPKIDLF